MQAHSTHTTRALQIGCPQNVQSYPVASVVSARSSIANSRSFSMTTDMPIRHYLHRSTHPPGQHLARTLMRKAGCAAKSPSNIWRIIAVEVCHRAILGWTELSVCTVDLSMLCVVAGRTGGCHSAPDLVWLPRAVIASRILLWFSCPISIFSFGRRAMEVFVWLLPHCTIDVSCR